MNISGIEDKAGANLCMRSSASCLLVALDIPSVKGNSVSYLVLFGSLSPKDRNEIFAG
jgi:hypothetical protein